MLYDIQPSRERVRQNILLASNLRQTQQLQELLCIYAFQQEAYGILSQNNDIEKIFIDGIFKIVAKLDSEDIIKLVAKLKAIGDKYNIDFIAAANTLPTDLPKEIADVLI